MNISRFLFASALVALSISPLASARSSKVDHAFVDAVKHHDMRVVNSLIKCIHDRRTFDKASREAARKGDVKLFHRLCKLSSRRGKRKASASLKRHHNIRCHHHSSTKSC